MLCKIIKNRMAFLFITAVALSIVSVSAQIDRMDIFDRADNRLLFVKFDYDKDGKNSGRSVYTSDSTFLRRTTFVIDKTGKTVREVSFDFNNDTIIKTDFSTIDKKPGISVLDQFNLNQFGAPVSYASDGDNSYDIYHNGSIVYRMKYMYGSNGELNRIDVLSTSNSLMYYVVVSTPSGVVQRSRISYKSVPKITFSDNRCFISADLKSVTDLKICIYNLSGQLVSVPFFRRLNPGILKEKFSVDAPSRRLSGNLYIATLYINGEAISSSRFIIRAGSFK